MLRCIRKLKQRRFEPSRSTKSKVFFLLTCLDANNCICLAKCLHSFRNNWSNWTKASPKKSTSALRASLKHVFYLLLLRARATTIGGPNAFASALCFALVSRERWSKHA